MEQRRKDCKGWGITLRGNQDYNLDGMVSKPDKFEVSYGADGTGDLTSLENISSFSSKVRSECKEGVSLVLGDGGFSVVGDEQYQEEHSKQLLIAQVLTMFRILSGGGNFVLKVSSNLDTGVRHLDRLFCRTSLYIVSSL